MRSKAPKTDRKRASDNRLLRGLRRVLIFVIIVVLMGLAGMHLFHLITGNELLAVPENQVASVLTPVQNGFSSVVDWVVDYLYKLKLRARIELEYNNLKQENEQLVYDAMLVEELQHKLSVYENLYDEISVNESMNPLVATVIGRESGNYFSVFTINKGLRDGVEDYMAVTMDGALVGYTYNVSETKSTVRTIIDSEASIAGLISSSRDQGTVRGTLGVDGTAQCRMYYLPEDTLPRPGDLVVTSGVGMSFPKGIPIGTVRESTRGMESNKQFVVVEPQADFQHIEYVIVLRYQPEAGAVEQRVDTDEITITPLDTPQPVPTIQIGSDFYQLAPTPEPTPAPTPTVILAEDGTQIVITPAPTIDADTSYEYKVPTGVSDEPSYGFTLPPTASPTPTAPPLDLTVEDD
ncbi:MAG: rod shape-determining protein MreC [Clostridia bacterium]|nr:rod shape-determining protein MreC [Clostridia bacterium]